MKFISGRLIIQAMNIHNGGGRSLLDALVNVDLEHKKLMLVLDERMPVTLNNKCAFIKKVKPTIFERFKAELWLLRNTKKNDLILCLGNLPPLFKIKGKTILFVQNKYILNYQSLSGFSFKDKVRLSIERIWFRLKSENVDRFIVQTPSMEYDLKKIVTNKDEIISIIPFVNNAHSYTRVVNYANSTLPRVFNYLYVASGEPHKNHHRLIRAWCLLAQNGFFPSLVLTIDQIKYADLCAWINNQIFLFNLKISNFGILKHVDILNLYSQVDALIYPSTFESFGLPLIEARQAGLVILASESDFVRDVIDPEYAFDPESSISIYRAVKRHLMLDEPPLPLCDAKQFLERILNEKF
jgi:glycosyltransferase involved in cell wall biosynthesis